MSLQRVAPNLHEAPLRNLLVNPNFFFWQAGGTSVTGIANGSSTYGPDQWYAKNSLGGSGVLRLDQTSPVLAGSQFGCQIKISTAPVSSQANGCELYQVLENPETLEVYNQAASFSIWVKALTNVNQIGVQFFYATSEVKLTTAIGSEQLYTVNSSTFTQCSISGQALGTSMTTSGVVGVRIRITGVSTGNTYDINNGFIVEQGMMNLGSNPAPFCTTGITFELMRCQRFYEKSYNLATTPGTVTLLGAVQFQSSVVGAGGTAQVNGFIQFAVRKRATPACQNYDTTVGTAGNVNLLNAAGSRNASSTLAALANPAESGVELGGVVGSSEAGMIFQWTADSRI